MWMWMWTHLERGFNCCNYALSLAQVRKSVCEYKYFNVWGYISLHVLYIVCISVYGSMGVWESVSMNG